MASAIPSHSFVDPDLKTYPLGHSQRYEPTVFLHVAGEMQLDASKHSSTSATKLKKHEQKI